MAALIQKPVSEFKSGGIMDSLEGLVETFTKSGALAFDSCMTVVYSLRKDVARYEIEKKQALKKKTAQEARQATRTTDRSNLEQQETDTKKQKKTDEKFID